MRTTSLLLMALVLGASPTGEPATTSQDGAPRTPQAPWPVYRGDRALSGVARGTLSARLELLWSYETGGPIASSPVVAGGVVYVGSSDGSVHAVALADGAVRWTHPTGDVVEAPPLLLLDRVYVGSADGVFHCLDARSGKELWSATTEDKILGGANHGTGADGRPCVVVGSYDTHLYCFDAATGKKLWAYETSNYVNGTPAVVDGAAIFGGCDAALHRVNIATGVAAEPIQLGDECHVAGSVAAAGSHVYFGHYGNAFVDVDLQAGAVAWEYPSRSHAFFSSPAILADRVVFGGRDRHLHCVDRKTGAPLWKFKTRRKVDGSPVACGDKVVFGSGDGRVYLLDVAEGKELWHYDIGRPVFSSPAVVSGRVVIGADDGRLYCFGPPRRETGR